MKDLTDGKLQEALDYAKKINDNSLQRCLDRLKQTDENMCQNGSRIIQTHIYTDFAPLSFEFVRCEYKNGPNNKPDFLSNGGIIFHGKHDGFGSGSAPTFSVCLEATNGWSIHT
jgi:hypothetical protein